MHIVTVWINRVNRYRNTSRVCWLLKLLILRYGGARLYRTAQPFFLGIIFGTVFASITQAAVPIIMVLLKKPYLKFVP